MLYLKLNTIQVLRKYINKLIAQVKLSPHPCTLHMALDCFSFQKQMACFQKSCLSRVRKLEMIAFKCTDLPGKEGAAIRDAVCKGEVSDLIYACPSLCLFTSATWWCSFH